MATVVGYVLYFGAALVSLFIWSWWPLVIIFAFDMAVVSVIFQWRTPLEQMTSEDVSRSRRQLLIGVAIFLLLVVIAGLTDR